MDKVAGYPIRGMAYSARTTSGKSRISLVKSLRIPFTIKKSGGPTVGIPLPWRDFMADIAARDRLPTGSATRPKSLRQADVQKERTDQPPRTDVGTLILHWTTAV